MVIEMLGCGGTWAGLGETLEGWGDGAFRVLSAQGMPRRGEHDIFRDSSWGIRAICFEVSLSPERNFTQTGFI